MSHLEPLIPSLPSLGGCLLLLSCHLLIICVSGSAEGELVVAIVVFGPSGPSVVIVCVILIHQQCYFIMTKGKMCNKSRVWKRQVRLRGSWMNCKCKINVIGLASVKNTWPWPFFKTYLLTTENISGNICTSKQIDAQLQRYSRVIFWSC